MMSTATSDQIQPAAATATVQPKPAQFTISMELDGFPVTVNVEGKAESLRAMVDRLKAIGATPPAKAEAAPATAANAPKPAGVPVCPVHNQPMKPSRKPGGFYCSKKTADGGYCDQAA